MLVMQHPVFRRYWYPVMALSRLADGPQPFTLLGEKLALWLAPDGTPVAFADKCPHRGIALSLDSIVVDGALRCGYHGWRFGPTGACVGIPQQPGQSPGGNLRGVRTFRAQARHGYAWVCLDEPIADIPPLPHAGEEGWRQVFSFDETWSVNMFRVIENALDIAHVSYVHNRTLGSDDKPVFPRLDLIDEPGVLGHRCAYPVVNTPDQQKNLGIGGEQTFRRQLTLTWLPGAFVLEITYPTGLVHSICGFATPIGDGKVQRIQWSFRNDTEADAPAANVAAFDRRVQSEDRRLLETMGADFPLNPRAEAHMAMDRVGLMYRERLAALILRHDPNADLVRAELAQADPRGARAPVA